MMASASERSPLLGNHGNQEPRSTKLKSAVAGFQSEEDDRSSLVDVDMNAGDRSEAKSKQLYV